MILQGTIMPIELLYLWGGALIIVLLLLVILRSVRRLQQLKFFIQGTLRGGGSIKTFLPRNHQRTRWLWLLVALFYAGVGPYLLAQRETLAGTYTWIEEWNRYFRFDLINLHNAVTAVISMLIGGIIFGWLSHHSPWFEEVPWLEWYPLHAARRWRVMLWPWFASFFFFVVMAWRLEQQDASSLPVLLWLLAIGSISWSIWYWERGNETDLAFHIAISDWVWLLALLVLGFAVGTAYLVEIPARMVGDEGSFWEAARRIAVGENINSFFGLGVYTFPIASSFFQAGILRLFGLSMWSWRFASVVAGLLSVIPLYLLTKELFDRRTAVTAAFVMLVSPYFLAFSRLGYNNSQALFPVTLCLYWVVLSLKRNSYFYLWLAGLAAGAGFYTYPAAQLGLILLVLIGGYLAAIRHFSLKQLAVFLGIVMLAWLLFRLPYFLHSAYGSDSVTPYKTWESLFFNTYYARSLFPDEALFRVMEPITIGAQQLFFEPSIYARLLVRGVVRSLLVFHGAFGRVSEHFIETGLAGGGIASAMLVLGSALAVRSWRQIRFALLLLWFGSGVFLLSVTNTFPPRQAHLVSIIPVLAIFIAAGLIAFADMLINSIVPVFHKVWSPRLAAMFVVAIAAIIGYTGIVNYFDKVAGMYPSNFEQVVAWSAIRLGQQGGGTIVYVEEEPQSHDVDYLLWAKVLTLDYKNWAAAEVLSGTAVLPHSSNLVVFIPASDADELLATITEQIDHPHAPILLSDLQDTPWGYVVTNSDMTFSQSVTIRGALSSLTSSPVWIILLTLFLLLLIGLIWLRVSKQPVKMRGQGDPAAMP
jgi:4-amino-4-deoxy-L-arabinose transferase-like glycosyltransferase